MRIGIDLDGVCYDFDGACRRWILANDILPAAALVPTVQWYMYRDWGMTDERFVAMCDEAENAGFLSCDGPPTPGTRDTLARLQDAGHTIHLVTARSFGSEGVSEANTAWWLDHWSIPHDSLTLAAKDKTVVPVDVALDDRDRNYDQLEAAGMRPFLWDTTYNRHHRGRRVFSWTDFESKVSLEAAWRRRGAA